MPSLALSAPPALCTTVAVEIGSSLGASSLAALLLGFAPASQVTPWGGTLLVATSSITYFTLGAAGLSLPVPLPCDPAFCNLDVFFHVLEVDPGASQGVSFTAGVQATLGI
ncbi:MAG: hypothetical protein AB1726_13375 [Planctomycetota bacterium]